MADTNESESARDGLIARALEAVRTGRLSVEEILREACHEPRVMEWLEQMLELRAAAPVRRLSLCQQPSGGDIEVKLEAARARLRDHPDVVGVGWGEHTTAGLHSGRTGLVVYVVRKEPEPARVLRSPLELTMDGVPRSVPFDVQELEEIEPQFGTAIHVGGRCAVRVENRQGTLSACLPNDDGSFTAILSGHVARAEGVRVEAQTTDGRLFELGLVKWQRDHDRMDAAAVPGLPPLLVSELTDGVTTVESSVGSTGLLVTLRLAGGSEPKALVDASSAEAIFQGRVMRGLLRLSRDLTQPGDSGAPAVDSLGRVIGFVIGVGRSGHTFLISAERVVREIQQANLVKPVAHPDPPLAVGQGPGG